MRYDPATDRIAIRHAEPRLAIEIPAAMIIEEGEPVEAILINFSRHGFRLNVAGKYAAGVRFRLEVAGWPRLSGRVVWNDKGRVGCLFEEPPSPRNFSMMCTSATGYDREHF